MTDYDAVMIAEGVDPASYSETLAAWQHLIDTGLVWKLQSWFGRQAMTMIQNGICQPPPAKVKQVKQEA